MILHDLKESFLSLLQKCYAIADITGESSGVPLQYSCLENPMDGGAW